MLRLIERRRDAPSFLSRRAFSVKPHSCKSANSSLNYFLMSVKGTEAKCHTFSIWSQEIPRSIWMIRRNICVPWAVSEWRISGGVGHESLQESTNSSIP